MIEDILNSQFALYRGSSAIIDAVKKGIIPLYLNCEEKIDVNPLKEFINKKNCINTPKDFKFALNHYKNKDFEMNNLSKYLSKIYDKRLRKNLVFRSLAK